MNSVSLKEAREALQRYWGYPAFREGQQEAIRAVLARRDTLVLLPTGGGKSLCYQVPAVVQEGMTLVISPLVALMQDQVQQLQDRDIAATFINSTLSSWEVEQRLVNARNGMYKLFYCAPERLKTTLWEAELPNLDIDLVAIDEAHCISEWGHDFRPSYRDIRPSLESIADEVGWVALTATATPEVRDDIVSNLQFDEPAVVSRGFQRPNLKWWVVQGPKKDRNVLRSVRKAVPQGAGIIYGGTRKNCERLAELIAGRLGVDTAAYHAGVEGDRRRAIQERWIEGELPVVVATTAFGMGIDKADCRFVIHYEMPYSLEAYYQQAGRAGRDGLESYPLLLFRESDARRARRRIEDAYPGREQLQKVYDALCDTLNLALGADEEEMREVSLPALQKRAGLPQYTVRASLDTLRHLGIIEMADYVVPQVGVHFVVNPDYLRERISKEDNQRKAAFMDVLYRQYGSEAFADIKYLDLDYVERKLDTDRNGVIKGLQVLQNHDHILQFESLGELPLVRPMEPRMRRLQLSRQQLEQHRDTLLKKLDYMLGYIETDQCRETYIRAYFGEEGLNPCGHCDNCIGRGEAAEQAPSTEDINTMKELLDGGALNLHEMKRTLQWNSTKIKRSLSYLLRENKVVEEGEKYRWRE